MNETTFDWPLAYEAEDLIRTLLNRFLEQNQFASALAARMRDEAGTDFYEWVDHLIVGPELEHALQEVELVVEDVEADPGATVYFHPRAMMPRILVREDGSRNGAPRVVAIKPESIVDFVARNDLLVTIEGEFGAPLRQALVAEQNGFQFVAVERLAYRGFRVGGAANAQNIAAARELWRTRKRHFSDDRSGIEQAFAVQQRAIDLVGRDAACELFFAEERHYWELRNRAGRIQKRRQDLLGLGWGNHDHHTFRCSRQYFADLIRFLRKFGFEKRERFYAGAEAGWGAQIVEHRVTGITVFADVDLMPEETEIDFSVLHLPEAPALRTVGLWCGLHGDSFLQAGMHHLEARFDFALLREQLAEAGVQTMKPFSDFDFLKQAFTAGERWPVRPERVNELVRRALITPEQAEGFLRDGAIGSHLENLQRRGGFKGFNQKSVSVIISATDPREWSEVPGSGFTESGKPNRE
jgi:hypothetical protein